MADFDNFTGFYFKTLPNKPDETKKFLDDFVFWMNNDDETYPNMIFKNSIDEMAGVFSIIFAFGRIILQVYRNNQKPKFLLSSFYLYLKILNKITKMPDDVHMFYFCFLSYESENFIYDSHYINSYRSIFSKITIDFCYKLINEFFENDDKIYLYCIKILKNCFKYHKCFLM